VDFIHIQRGDEARANVLSFCCFCYSLGRTVIVFGKLDLTLGSF